MAVFARQTAGDLHLSNIKDSHFMSCFFAPAANALTIAFVLTLRGLPVKTVIFINYLLISRLMIYFIKLHYTLCFHDCQCPASVV